MLAHADLAAFKVIGIVLEIYEHCEYCIMLLFRANLSKPKCGGSPGDTTIYGLYRYVPL